MSDLFAFKDRRKKADGHPSASFVFDCSILAKLPQILCDPSTDFFNVLAAVEGGDAEVTFAG